MGTPLELVRYAADGKFEVGKEAVQALRKVKGPVGVVAVCGRARQGKSFILNQLLKQAGGGFEVGPTQKPCTKGLWMWSQPIQHTLPDGTRHHLVLLDTEGIEAYDQTGQYSTQIFCLAVLLSSLFVYNQMGGIDESALDRLSLVTEMTKRIRVRANVQEATTEDLARFTPSFLWLLRDAYLQLAEDGKPITPKDYLETALQAVPGQGPAIEAKNSIRNSIKALFPDRECFRLVRPMNDEAHLMNLDKIPRSRLRKEFLTGLDELTSLIFSKASPRQMGSIIVTGPILSGLVQAYVEALNEGAVPTIATAWQGVTEAECRRAVDTAEQVYSTEFLGEQVPPEEADLEREHQRALQLALATFEDNAVGEGAVMKAHQQRLVQVCNSRYEAVKKTRMAEASAAINDILYRANVQLQTTLRSGNATTKQLHELLKTFLESYITNTSGPTKWKRLVEFLQDSFLAAAQELASAQEQRLQQQVEQATKLNQESEQKLQDAMQQLVELQHTLSQTHHRAIEADAFRAQLQKQQAQSEVAAKSYQGKIAALEAQLRDVVALERRKAHSAEEAASTRVHLATEQLGQLQAAVKAERERLQQTQLNLEREAARKQSLEGQLATARQEVEHLQHSCMVAANDTAVKDQQLASLQETVTRLQADLAAAATQRDQAQARLSEQQGRHREFESTLDEHMAEAQQEAQAASSSRPRGRSAKVGLEGMTVNQLKGWLTENGHDDEVWANSSSYKKQDWLKLVQKYGGDTDITA